MKRTDNRRQAPDSGEKASGLETVPLFDCLAHPTLTGEWLSGSPSRCAAMDRLVRDMETCNVRWAFAVGLKGVGGYDETVYSRFVRDAHPAIFPVAYLDFDTLAGSGSVRPLLVSLKDQGYAGIKIHPRLAGITFDNPLLPLVVNTASEIGMAIMLCTYFYDSRKSSLGNNVESLARLLHETRDSRVILLHAGSVRLLEMMEMARAYGNILLDLSFTLCKYRGSSLDLDLAYAFKHFDRRICIGSDHPEFPLQEMRDRFEHFSAGIEQEKKENIAYRNLFQFTGITCHEAL